MSQHSLRPLDPAIGMVLVGWDPGLQTYYARPVPGDDAPPGTPALWTAPTGTRSSTRRP
ncbi:hypothetical protein [Pseudonocardia aurantiaca]|uniref:Uncharacterized protein n=1 Tax=Pseudonocardia aurantiaca TaxID=75290 RepID=A0ABW4FH18_9PSEU